jgi:hypothetical protein
MDRRLRCLACGTWTCASCGWQRHGASLDRPQDCARCGSTSGTLVPTRHGSVRGIWEDHNPAAGPTCALWHNNPCDPPYVPFPGPCGHLSCRTIAWKE